MFTGMTGDGHHARFYFDLSRDYRICRIDTSVKIALALVNL